MEINPEKLWETVVIVVKEAIRGKYPNFRVFCCLILLHTFINSTLNCFVEKTIDERIHIVFLFLLTCPDNAFYFVSDPC